MSVYQWAGANNADLGNGGNWVDVSEPGMGQPPGPQDVAIIQIGVGLHGVLNVAGLDLVDGSSTSSLSITGSSTQVTAGSVGIGNAFTLDTGAYLQAGTLGIDGDGTAVTVQNNAYLYVGGAQNDVMTIGASAGNASVLVTRGGTFTYDSAAATGTLDLGGVSNSEATLTVSAGGEFSASLSGISIGAASGATGILDVTGADSQFLVNNYGYTTIGDFGERGGSAQGTVAVTNGGYASLSSAGEVDVGTSAGMAEILVSGVNSAVQAGPLTEIGQSGTNIAGEILVEAGGEFDNATDIALNNGTILVTGANSLLTARILRIDNGTTTEITNGGVIHVADVELAGKLILVGGTMNTRESFFLDGGSEVVGRGALTAATIGNAGQIIASGGTLVVSGSITGTGALGISTSAALQLANAVVATQNIVFGTGANTLLLADAPGVAAHILDFATGDAIDLLGDAATKLSYAAGALTISNGTTLVAKLQVRGTYATANFKLSSDGHGGSLITYAATGAVTPRPIGDPIGAMSPPHLAY